MWGGCGKNGNNFRELSDCETTCAKHLSPGKLDEKKADEPGRVGKPFSQTNVIYLVLT